LYELRNPTTSSGDHWHAERRSFRYDQRRIVVHQRWDDDNVCASEQRGSLASIDVAVLDNLRRASSLREYADCGREFSIAADIDSSGEAM